MKQIADLLPEGVIAQIFAGGIVLIGPELDTATYKQIMSGIPEKLREPVIGWRRVGVLPRMQP